MTTSVPVAFGGYPPSSAHPRRFPPPALHAPGLFFSLLLGLFLAPTFRAETAEKPPNILFLLADDMRPDCVAALGNPRIETPNLDRLAARGVAFTRATCSYPICVISRAEMLSGRHGWENGYSGIGRGAFVEGVDFWAETLRQAGYETWHVGKWHIGGRPSGLGYTDVAGHFASGGRAYWEPGQTDWKGFPVTGFTGWIFQSEDGRTLYPDPEFGAGLTADISAKIIDAAISLVERQPEAPWFCHVNFTAPHDPLILPPGLEDKYSAEDMALPENFLPYHPFDHGNFGGRDEALLAWPRTPEAVRDLLRVYHAVIDDMDAQIGRLLAALEETGQLDDTLVIFASDHGMACGSHGLRGKQNMYEHTINVPLIAAGPGVREGHVTEAQVYLRDLYPTTCEFAGATVPASVTARSFAPVLRGETDAHRDTIHGYFTDTQRMLRTDDGWKIVRYPQADRWQLFDLNRDPHELDDLAESDDPTHRAVFDELRARLAAWRQEAGDPVDDE